MNMLEMIITETQRDEWLPRAREGSRASGKGDREDPCGDGAVCAVTVLVDCSGSLHLINCIELDPTHTVLVCKQTHTELVISENRTNVNFLSQRLHYRHPYRRKLGEEHTEYFCMILFFLQLLPKLTLKKRRTRDVAQW